MVTSLVRLHRNEGWLCERTCPHNSKVTLQEETQSAFKQNGSVCDFQVMHGYSNKLYRQLCILRGHYVHTGTPNGHTWRKANCGHWYTQAPRVPNEPLRRPPLAVKPCSPKCLCMHPSEAKSTPFTLILTCKMALTNSGIRTPGTR